MPATLAIANGAPRQVIPAGTGISDATQRRRTMEGYEVVTVDEHKIGKVVGQSGDFLIVEQGALLKSKHALPREFAHVDDSAQLVRVTVPKEIVSDSPKVDDRIDEREVAEHYGLSTSPGPASEGQGEMPR